MLLVSLWATGVRTLPGPVLTVLCGAGRLWRHLAGPRRPSCLLGPHRCGGGGGGAQGRLLPPPLHPPRGLPSARKGLLPGEGVWQFKGSPPGPRVGLGLCVCSQAPGLTS